MARLLIVEDEVVISLNTSMILEDEGHVVEQAYHGEEAMEIVQSFHPDLILTDFMMPRMDGLALIAALRASGWRGPIILSSAIPEANLPPDRARGHDAYLSKPYSSRQLTELIDALLARG